MSTSSTSRSYASGLDSVNASPYWKSIVMSRTSIVRAGHLGAELQRDALVRLHPDDELVVAEQLDVGRRRTAGAAPS